MGPMVFNVVFGFFMGVRHHRTLTFVKARMPKKHLKNKRGVVTPKRACQLPETRDFRISVWDTMMAKSCDFMDFGTIPITFWVSFLKLLSWGSPCSRLLASPNMDVALRALAH